MKPIKRAVCGRQIAPGDIVIYDTPGTIKQPHRVVKLPNHSDNTPSHVQGDLHLEGLKPLLWVNYSLRIIE